jgi:anthranilate/para-aminobenzoate synthase component II
MIAKNILFFYFFLFYTYSDKKRDQKEIDDYYRYKGIPMLGICRGAQFLTVMSGGRLIQDVSGHQSSHTISTGGMLGTYTITSDHHQMMYPFDLSKEKYILIAYSEYFRSNYYLNGNNNEIELSQDFLEPEIVYYKNNNSLCIQGHPEYSSCSEDTTNLCLHLIEQYLFKNKIFKNSNYDIDLVGVSGNTMVSSNNNYHVSILNSTDENEFLMPLYKEDEDFEESEEDYIEEEKEIQF